MPTDLIQECKFLNPIALWIENSTEECLHSIFGLHYAIACLLSYFSWVQLHATPWINYSLPCSSIHGIFQAGILEWVAISSSRGSSCPRLEPVLPRVRILYRGAQTPGNVTICGDGMFLQSGGTAKKKEPPWKVNPWRGPFPEKLCCKFYYFPLLVIV